MPDFLFFWGDNFFPRPFYRNDAMFLTLESLKLEQVHTCTTAKQIELESHGWSGLVRF